MLTVCSLVGLMQISWWYRPPCWSVAAQSAQLLIWTCVATTDSDQPVDFGRIRPHSHTDTPTTLLSFQFYPIDFLSFKFTSIKWSSKFTKTIQSKVYQPVYFLPDKAPDWHSYYIISICIKTCFFWFKYLFKRKSHQRRPQFFCMMIRLHWLYMRKMLKTLKWNAKSIF